VAAGIMIECFDLPLWWSCPIARCWSCGGRFIMWSGVTGLFLDAIPDI